MTTRVGVLMATYNGAAWLDEQLASIAGQTGVTPKLIVSDDHSSDASVSIVAAWNDRLEVVQLPTSAERFGTANHNFMRLVRDAQIADCDYVALADQDDIWQPNKLSRAVEILRDRAADAYSSNVTAFWDGGRSRVIVQSRPQKRYDHLFQAPGPGCTFVMSRKRFEELQIWVRQNYLELTRVRAHDWMIYLFARERGWIWTIDGFSGLDYRQHHSNEMGVHVGWRASLKRWKRLADGSFRCDVKQIAHVAGHNSTVTRRLQRFRFLDRVWLASQAGQFRRHWPQSIVLAIALLTMKRLDC